MNTATSIAQFRKELPQLEGKIYLDHAASSVVPASVTNACVEGVTVQSEYSLSSESRGRWSSLRHETRKAAADLIGTSPDHIAFVQSTSAALSIVSLAIPWKGGENVVACGIDNPAAVVPWQNLGHLGIELRYLPANRDDLVDLSALPGLVDAQTRLVALSLVQYATGQRLDLARVAEFCRPRGILVCVDAVQAVGAVPVDVGSLGANFLAFGAQKWLMGPRNIALLYADDVALEQARSPIVTESNVEDIRVEEELPTSGVPRLKVGEHALKLEAVPYNNFPGVLGLRQALENIRTIGPTAIHQRVHEVTDELCEALKEFQGRVISPRGDGEWSGIVTLEVTGADPRDLVRRLREEAVYVAVRKGRVRISPHYYNSAAEIRAFLSTLSREVRSTS